MRAGKVRHLVVRAIIVGLVTLGAWAAATVAAHASFDWTISPADVEPNPTVTAAVDGGQE